MIERPRSGFALYGIAMSSERAGDVRAAVSQYGDFLAAWKDADRGALVGTSLANIGISDQFRRERFSARSSEPQKPNDAEQSTPPDLAGCVLRFSLAETQSSPCALHIEGNDRPETIYRTEGIDRRPVFLPEFLQPARLALSFSATSIRLSHRGTDEQPGQSRRVADQLSGRHAAAPANRLKAGTEIQSTIPPERRRRLPGLRLCGRSGPRRAVRPFALQTELDRSSPSSGPLHEIIGIFVLNIP